MFNSDDFGQKLPIRRAQPAPLIREYKRCRAAGRGAVVPKRGGAAGLALFGGAGRFLFLASVKSVNPVNSTKYAGVWAQRAVLYCAVSSIWAGVILSKLNVRLV